MLSIIIAGALGRMGKAIRDIAKNENDIKIGSLIEREDHPMIGEFFDDLKLESSLGDIIDKGDVVIDFTTPSASLEHLKIVAKYKKAIIIGTTGFSDNQKDEIKRFSKDAKVVLSPNMSVGINLLSHIIGLVTEVLGADFDTEIVEFHHHFKKDAPSGTALMLAEVIAKVRGYKLDKDLIFGRYGNVGARPQDQIGIHAVRAGDIVGEHLILFCGEGERIEITHRAHNRYCFAKGAIRAARWVVDKPFGFYDMLDVLGLKRGINNEDR